MIYMYQNGISMPLTSFTRYYSTTFSNNNFTGILRFHDNNIRHHSNQAYSFINP